MFIESIDNVSSVIYPLCVTIKHMHYFVTVIIAYQDLGLGGAMV